MIFHLETADGGYCVQVMVVQVREKATRGPEGIKELVVGVVHLINPEHCFQATLVKRFVVGHQEQALNQGFYLRPDVRENRCIIGICTAKAVNLGTPIVVVVRLRLNERIECIDNLPSRSFPRLP